MPRPSMRHAGALRQLLPPDVVPYSRAEILRRESDHWVGQTATGKLFAFGVLVATIVASAVIYQVLSNDVRDHLAEYATLKAMGHSNRYLSRVVIQQALLYAGAAYVIAVALGFGLYRATEALAGIPMRLTPAILGLTLLGDGPDGPGLRRVHPRKGLESGPGGPVLKSAAPAGRERASRRCLAAVILTIDFRFCRRRLSVAASAHFSPSTRDAGPVRTDGGDGRGSTGTSGPGPRRGRDSGRRREHRAGADTARLAPG